MSLDIQIKAYTQALNNQGLLRQRVVTQPTHSSLIHFDSNDYLSLSVDKELLLAYQKGYRDYPCGSGASMLFSGYHPNHQMLERSFAQFLGVDDCLLFSSGYAANLAIASLLSRIDAYCLVDKGIHASVYDGLAMSGQKYTRFLHNDPEDLANKLSPHPGHAAVLTEGIFSMSGQKAPLSSISSLCLQKNSGLIVDEAHSFGVLGAQGQGAIHEQGLTQDEVPLRTIVFGKALAGQGALVAGKKEWIEALLQAGRSAIYSTAISPALCYGLNKALERVSQSDERRTHLMHLIQLFKDHIRRAPHRWADSDTPIQQVQLGCPHQALHYAQELKKRGIHCFAVRSPTVSVKATGLRIVLNYRHQPDDLDLLFRSLESLYDTAHY